MDEKNGNGNRLKDRVFAAVMGALLALIAGGAATLALWDRATASLRACDEELMMKNAEQDHDIRDIEKTMTRLDERTARMEKDISEIKEAVK